jgi:UV DNA damage repair endonuclease
MTKTRNGKATAYTLLRALTADDKLAKQARQMAEAALNDHGVGTKITTEQFIESATPAIETKQPVGRVLAYYTKTMEDMGIVEVERAAPAVGGKKKSKDGEEASEDDVDGEIEDADGDDGSDD